MSPDAKFEMRRKREPWTFTDLTDTFVAICCAVALVFCLVRGL